MNRAAFFRRSGVHAGGVARAALVASVALAGCTGHRPVAEPRPTHLRRPDGSVLITGPSTQYVYAEPAARAAGLRDRVFAGRVTFDDRRVARVGPPVQGRVASVNYVVGDRVHRGDVLLTIHSPDVATLRAQLAETRTQRQLAEANVQRATLLAAQQAASQAELIQAQAALAQARDEERRAAQALSAVGGASGAGDYQLRSPIDGTVVERNVAVGTEVHSDQDEPLLTVADLSTVWVVLDVYEQDLPRVAVGDAARVDVGALPGRPIEGTILYVGDTIDPRTRAAHARIELPNVDRSLRPGMFAQAAVRVRMPAESEVPTSAIVARRDQYYVFVRNPDGSYSEREVHVGEQFGNRTDVLDGLQPGETVVTAGAILLDAEANEAL